MQVEDEKGHLGLDSPTAPVILLEIQLKSLLILRYRVLALPKPYRGHVRQVVLVVASCFAVLSHVTRGILMFLGVLPQPAQDIGVAAALLVAPACTSLMSWKVFCP